MLISACFVFTAASITGSPTVLWALLLDEALDVVYYSLEYSISHYWSQVWGAQSKVESWYRADIGCVLSPVLPEHKVHSAGFMGPVAL